jgi:hypothetical protein
MKIAITRVVILTLLILAMLINPVLAVDVYDADNRYIGELVQVLQVPINQWILIKHYPTGYFVRVNVISGTIGRGEDIKELNSNLWFRLWDSIVHVRNDYYVTSKDAWGNFTPNVTELFQFSPDIYFRGDPFPEGDHFFPLKVPLQFQ